MFNKDKANIIIIAGFILVIFRPLDNLIVQLGP